MLSYVLCNHVIVKYFLHPVTYCIFFFVLFSGNDVTAQRTILPENVLEKLDLESFITYDVLSNEGRLNDRIAFLKDSLSLSSKDYKWNCLEWFNINVVEEDRIKKHQKNIQGIQKTKRFKNSLLHRLYLFSSGSQLVVGDAGSNSAISFLYEAIDLAKKNKDRQMEFDGNMSIADFYLDLKKHSSAVEWLEKAKKSLLFVDDNVNRCSFHRAMADALDSIYFDKSEGLVRDFVEKPLQAIEHIEQAIQYAKRAIKDGQENQLSCSMLELYHIRAHQTNAQEEKLKYILLGLSYTTTYTHPWLIGQEEIMLVIIYSRMDKQLLAKSYLDSARITLGSIELLPEILKHRIYEASYFCHNSFQELDSAIYYLGLTYEAEKKIREDEALVELKLNESKFDDAKLKLTIQEQKVKLIKKEKRTQILLFTAIFGIIVAIVVTIFLLRARLKRKRIKALVIQLEQNVDEKTTLIQEVNHRVKNNLQMIIAFVDAQARNNNEKETIYFSNSIRKRIRAVSLVHELIMEEDKLSGVYFKDYLEELVQELESIDHEGGALHLETDFDPIVFGLSTTMYLGVLFTELLTNSMKYATNNQEDLYIWISLKRSSDGLLLKYRDSGPGIPDAILKTKQSTKSIGLSLIDSMAKQLDSTLVYNRDDESHYQLSFPVPDDSISS